MILCGVAYWYINKPVTWTEDVQLSDGSVIEIKQLLHGEVRANNPELFDFWPGVWRVSEYEIRFSESTGIKAPWTGDGKPVEPLVIDKTKEGEYYLITTNAGCKDLLDMAKKEAIKVGDQDFIKIKDKDILYDELIPIIDKYLDRDRYYFEYRYRNNNWIRLNEKREDFIKLPNLIIFDNELGNFNRWHYTLKDKKYWQENKGFYSANRKIDKSEYGNCKNEIPSLEGAKLMRSQK
jgi:hypothetical protein